MVEAAKAIVASGQSPLEYMLGVMRDAGADQKRRDMMAMGAAPFVHPRLAAVEMSGDLTVTHEDALSRLEQDAYEDDAGEHGHAH